VLTWQNDPLRTKKIARVRRTKQQQAKAGTSSNISIVSQSAIDHGIELLTTVLLRNNLLYPQQCVVRIRKSTNQPTNQPTTLLSALSGSFCVLIAQAQPATSINTNSNHNKQQQPPASHP